MGTVRVRYLPEGQGFARSLAASLLDEGATFDEGTDALRFGAAVAAFGMILRGSANVGDASLRDALRWGQAALGNDPGGLRQGFVELLERAIEIQSR